MTIKRVKSVATPTRATVQATDAERVVVSAYGDDITFTLTWPLGDQWRLVYERKHVPLGDDARGALQFARQWCISELRQLAQDELFWLDPKHDQQTEWLIWATRTADAMVTAFRMLCEAGKQERSRQCQEAA